MINHPILYALLYINSRNQDSKKKLTTARDKAEKDKKRELAAAAKKGGPGASAAPTAGGAPKKFGLPGLVPGGPKKGGAPGQDAVVDEMFNNIRSGMMFRNRRNQDGEKKEDPAPPQ